jgi:hypothetical protein
MSRGGPGADIAGQWFRREHFQEPQARRRQSRKCRNAVIVTRLFIDPPEQPEEQLPETTEPSPAIERPSPQGFKRPLPTPRLGII